MAVYIKTKDNDLKEVTEMYVNNYGEQYNIIIDDEEKALIDDEEILLAEEILALHPIAYIYIMDSSKYDSPVKVWEK